MKNLAIVDEVKAETILTVSGNETVDDIMVSMSGIFYRNYWDDCMKHKKHVLSLSRNSIYHLLPEGLFLKSNSLKGLTFQEQHDKIREIRENTGKFFQPVDTEFFRLTFELEKILQDMADRGNTLFSPAFSFDILEFETNNPYIRKIGVLLPYIHALKGNIPLLRDLLKYVFSASRVDAIRRNPFFIRFIIHKERLSKKEYHRMDREVEVFFDFFREWFLPVEIECDFRIKDYKQFFNLGHTLLLDYNINL